MRFVTILLLTLAITASATPSMQEALNRLDDILEHRSEYIACRQARIDSLKTELKKDKSSEILIKLADEYSSFNNDSAIYYLSEGVERLDIQDKAPFQWRLASLVPLTGFFEYAVVTFEAIDAQTLTPEQLPKYLDAGRQMYSYMGSYRFHENDFSRLNAEKALDYQSRLLSVLPEDSREYIFNKAEYLFLTNHQGAAKVLLEEFVASEPEASTLRAKAAHHLARIAQAEGNQTDYIRFLALSAQTDALTATREVASLQELGAALHEDDQIARAHNYLSIALANAVECGAALRMIDTARALPLIEHAHTAQIDQWRKTAKWIMAGLVLILIVLVATLLFLRREMKHLQKLQQALRKANHAKEVYISQFLQLCSIYMDKLNQFCKIATRKLAAGQSDELYRMTKSGKFVEDQSREFFEIFDNAFLHIYPTFVEDVNTLFLEDKKIIPEAGERLNTDLRILAFMRLGIDESARIAQILNYSLNTIYAYRNRLKSRAINRDTFEDDVRHISSPA